MSMHNHHYTCTQVGKVHVWCVIFYPGFFPAVLSQSLNSSLDGLLACPGQEIYFVCHVNSPLLLWSSLEYIGPPGVRIEFSAILDGVGDIMRAMNAEATLLSVNGLNVTSSELIITASQAFPTASVTCDDGTRSMITTFEVPGMLDVN